MVRHGIANLVCICATRSTNTIMLNASKCYSSDARCPRCWLSGTAFRTASTKVLRMRLMYVNTRGEPTCLRFSPATMSGRGRTLPSCYYALPNGNLNCLCNKKCNSLGVARSQRQNLFMVNVDTSQSLASARKDCCSRNVNSLILRKHDPSP
jgi:hypothetical protein